MDVVFGIRIGLLDFCNLNFLKVTSFFMKGYQQVEAVPLLTRTVD